ncbi:hypothetical protein EYF80_051100 [Liparis tanakae]|uniref:Uncharacterized protein n=1 Tax=Liparis tanakae TaxID=230148 RepID=A0A4Z2FDA0_9TELE|nr:hypothetical protein EYF80_051100 [Liparis tanakae]
MVTVQSDGGGKSFGHLTELLVRQEPQPHTLQLILSVGIVNCLTQKHHTTIPFSWAVIHVLLEER